jgi:putative DNA methylase
MDNNNLFKSIHKSRLIESDNFPVEFLSTVGNRESWRKEIYRPVYHIHKWWAKRLGSIFRGILLGCLLSDETHLEDFFYNKHNFTGVSVFDPFMGSGTTIGEAHKLGCSAFGRDINPVACESVRVALGALDRFKLKGAFTYLSSTVGPRIRKLYQSTDEHGHPGDVLYFFWVKYVPCPNCSTDLDLFSSRIIARNAYPDRKPEIQTCCPRCYNIFPALNHDKNVCCPTCELEFNPHYGNTKGTKASCPNCMHSFSIAKAVRSSDRPPAHRLYGKLLLTQEGEKRYLPAADVDIKSYEECSQLLKSELERGPIRLPGTMLIDGFNTRQAIGYNYHSWRDFFNDRQLLALGWLHEAIAEISDSNTRDALLILFSGLLEFNNLFASYKGEGTGAVRHMFSHHILKPERTPIEANVWGTPKSSGSFLNLFKTRMMRVLDYRAAPYETKVEGAGKSPISSAPFTGIVETSWPKPGNFKPRGIYLTCGSSDKTGLPDCCMDFVVTDPPFFDNVHYSELADFFYAWQSLYPRGFIKDEQTTRNILEVQDTDAANFAKKLCAVFTECSRVLKDEGLLVFSYHHSRAEGWVSLVEAVFGAGFSVVNVHPVKSEMSVATPKSQSKDPIQLDVILVCKKKKCDIRTPKSPSEAFDEAIDRASQKLERLTLSGLKLSKKDRLISLISQFISAIGPGSTAGIVSQLLLTYQKEFEKVVENLPYEHEEKIDTKVAAKSSYPEQRSFSFDWIVPGR